jgi:hypothetical protein
VALGAVPMATGVIAARFVATRGTLRLVAPAGGSPTHGASPQGAVLRAGQGRAIPGEERATILVHDVSHFEGRAVHNAGGETQSHPGGSVGSNHLFK